MEMFTSLFGAYIRLCDRTGQWCVPSWYVGNRTIELAVVACVFTLVQLVLIKHVGFQGRLRSIRRSMVASAYGMLLYWRRPRAIVVGELRLVGNSLTFLVFLLPSLVVGGLLFAGMWNTLSERYDRGPLEVGEEAVVRTSVSSDSERALTDCDTSGDARDLEITARVRAPAVRTVWTRVKPKRAGLLRLDVGQDRPVRCLLNVATWEAPVAPRRTTGGVEVNIGYPRRRWWGLRHGWLITFLVACVGAAWPLGRLLKTHL